MTEEKEDSDQPGRNKSTKHFDTVINFYTTTEEYIRFKKKCRECGISQSSFIRNAIEAFLGEDERIDFIVERSEQADYWDTWKAYRLEQEERDKETHEKFTREEVEDIFENIESMRMREEE